jgi:hypothetical protein
VYVCVRARAHVRAYPLSHTPCERVRETVCVCVGGGVPYRCACVCGKVRVSVCACAFVWRGRG